MSPTTAPSPISDERAIANLMVEYAYRNDDLDVAGLGDLFAESAFTLDGQTVRGREEVVSLAGQMIQPRDDGRSATTHEITNVMVEVDLPAGTAVGQAYWTLYATVTGQPREALQSGRYLDAFENRSGTWRFTERVATTLWRL